MNLLFLLACQSDLAEGDSRDVDTQETVDDSGQDDSGGDADTGPIDTGDPSAERCAPLAAPTGRVVTVSPGQDLEAILEGLESGDTAMLEAGTYALSADAYISLKTDNVRIQGATGRAEDVVIDGDFEAAFGFSIQASDVVVSDLTLRRFYYHPLHITPADGRSISGVRIHRVRVIDGLEQAIKINTSGEGTLFADQGVVSCSLLELTEVGRPQVRNNCYTGGTDAHEAQGWHVRDNVVQGFWCASGLSEHGIHFWRGGRGNLIEGNLLYNNARGVGLGLGQDGVGRRYSDPPCGGVIAQRARALRSMCIKTPATPRRIAPRSIWTATTAGTSR